MVEDFTKKFRQWIDTEFAAGKKKAGQVVEQVAKAPIQAAVGLIPGALESIPNTLATVGLGAQGVLNTALGKEKSFENLDNYNKEIVNINNSIGQGIFGNDYNDQAFNAGAATGDLLGPSALIRPLGKVAKIAGQGGLADKIENLAGNPILSGSYGLESHLATKARKNLIDPLATKIAQNTEFANPLVEGLATAQKFAREDIPKFVGENVSKIPLVGNPLANLPEDISVSFAKNILNPRTAEDMARKEFGTDIFDAISEKKGTAIGNLKDLGQSFFYDKADDLVKAGKKDVVDLKLNDLQNYLKKDLGIDLKKIDKNSLAPILDEINTGLRIAGEKVKRLNADTNYKLAKQGYEKAIRDFPDDVQMQEDYRKSMVKASYDEITSKGNILEKNVYKPGISPKSIDEMRDSIKNTYSKKVAELAEIDPNLAKDLEAKFKTSAIGEMSKYALFGNSEAAVSDLLQYNRNSTAVRDKYIIANNVLDTDIMKNSRGAVNWRVNNDKMLTEAIRKPNALFTDSINNSILENNVKSVKSALPFQFFKKLPIDKTLEFVKKAVDNSGFSFQEHNRLLIMNSIIDDAYSIAKAKGMKEGTENFNKFIIDTSKSMMEDLGIAKKKTSFGIKGGAEKQLSFDDMVSEGAGKILPGQLGKEAKAAALSMSSWVKGATMSNLQSFNMAKDALYRVSKTGKISAADRLAIIKFGLDSVVNLGLFGLRGAKIPGAFVEAKNPLDNSSMPMYENPNSMATWAVGLLADIFNIGNEDLLKAVKDGFYGYVSGGASSSRQTTIPITGSSTGSDIASGLFKRYMGILPAGIQGNWAEVIKPFLPKSAIAMADAKINGAIRGFKDKDVSMDFDKSNQESISKKTLVSGMLQKPSVVDVDSIKTPATSLEKISEQEVIDKYANFTKDQLIDSDDFFSDLESLPEERRDSVAESILDSIEKGVKSTVYTKIKSNKANLKALSPEVPEQAEILREINRSMTDEQSIQAAAEAGLNKDDDSFEVLYNSKIASGLNETQLNTWVDSVFDELERLEAQKANKRK